MPFVPDSKLKTNQKEEATSGFVPDAPEEPGLLKSLVRGVASPFLRLGVTAYNTLSPNSPQETQRNLGYFGDVKPITSPVKTGGAINPETGKLQNPFSGKGLRETVGAGAEIASNLPGGKAIGSIGKATLKGLVKQGAKRGAIEGGQAGLLSGLGQGLQEEDASIGSVVGSTALGGVLGAGGGGLIGGVAPIPVAGLNTFRNLRNPEKVLGKLEGQYRKILNLTQRQTQVEERFAKNTPRFLAQEGIELTSKSGKLNTADAVASLLEKSDAENEAFNQVLKTSGRYASLDDMALRAKDNAKRTLLGSERQKAMKFIDQEVNALKGQFSESAVQGAKGDTLIPIDQFNRVKQSFWKKTTGFGSPESALQENSYFKLGDAAKEIIEESIDDASIKALNARLGDFASAIRLLKKRDGAVIGGGRLSRIGARIIGAVAGSGGGPGGSIIGTITADKLADVLQDPTITTFATRRLLKSLEKEGKATVVDEARRIISQRNQQIQRRLLLPAQAGPSNTVIPLGARSESTVLGQEAQRLSSQRRFQSFVNDIRNPSSQL